MTTIAPKKPATKEQLERWGKVPSPPPPPPKNIPYPDLEK